ncbi:MAG TPA: hypothetical protein VF311_03980, partial [Terriglobales bacterium]
AGGRKSGNRIVLGNGFHVKAEDWIKFRVRIACGKSSNGAFRALHASLKLNNFPALNTGTESNSRRLHHLTTLLSIIYLVSRAGLNISASVLDLRTIISTRRTASNFRASTFTSIPRSS